MTSMNGGENLNGDSNPTPVTTAVGAGATTTLNPTSAQQTTAQTQAATSTTVPTVPSPTTVTANGSGNNSNSPQTSLFVGNLDARVYRELLTEIFSLAGRVTQCHIVYDKTTGQSSGFGFVHYEDHATAEAAIDKFRGRSIYGKLLTIDWARASNTNNNSSNNNSNGDMNGNESTNSAGHYCLFVGNLSPNVTDEQLVTAFSEFGSCTSAKCAKNPVTYETQGFAFVSFRERADAVSAMQAMNGQLLNNRPLRVDWAKGKTGGGGGNKLGDDPQNGADNNTNNFNNKSNYNNNNSSSGTKEPMTYEAILTQTSVNNITAYISGLPLNTNEETIRETFQSFGPIRDIRIPESSKSTNSETMYAFVRYMDHASAAKAIFESQHGGTKVADKTVNVHWGREVARRFPQHQQHPLPHHNHLPHMHQRQFFNQQQAHAFQFQQFPPQQQQVNNQQHSNPYFQPSTNSANKNNSSNGNYNNLTLQQQQSQPQQAPQQSQYPVQQNSQQPQQQQQTPSQQPQQNYGYGYQQQQQQGQYNGTAQNQQEGGQGQHQMQQQSRYHSYGRGGPPGGAMHQTTASAQHRFHNY